MKNTDEIKITKARVHNLKNVDLVIPKNTLTVVTGPSGSGKSSLAFDTIYVEGQRRYIESLSSYARQFLGQFQPPDVESITGLSPAIAIDQKTSSRNPRSTVGTVTEIYDYLRILFARAGTMFCPESGKEIKTHQPAQIVREILSSPEKTKVHLMTNVSFKKKEKAFMIKKFLSMGFAKHFIDGEVKELDAKSKIKEKNDQLELVLVIDRLLAKKENEKRLHDSVEYAFSLGSGSVSALLDEKLETFYEKNVSPHDGTVFPDLEPRLFSFNSPIGACKRCNGIGVDKSFNQDFMVLDPGLSIANGALLPLKRHSFLARMIENIAIAENIDIDTPFNKLPKRFIKILFEGTQKTYTYSFESENSSYEFQKSFPGIIAWLDRRYHESSSEKVRKNMEEFMTVQQCPSCKGQRLNKVALNVLVQKKNIIELSELSIEEAHQFFSKLKLKGEKAVIAEKLLIEIRNRLTFLVDVGLEYLTLSRSAASLSGGESQRIRLATQIGSALSGVLYVLDEPSIGLHQRDNEKLIQTLQSLKELGNTVIVVEHDEETMRAADFIVDMGPKAGVHGGEVVAAGSLAQVKKVKNSITSEYLSGRKEIFIPEERRISDAFINLRGAKHNNLKGVDVKIPLEVLTCVSGVSGSGKSTLIHEVLVPAVKSKLLKAHAATYTRRNYQSITGLDALKSIIELDQSPIGRTPHSNPATYTGLFDEIRKLFAKLPDSQVRGYKAGRFSFNVKGGRCEECEGNGVKKIEMHFLPDVFITCGECGGKRYNNETLTIGYKGKNISDVLTMTVAEAADFFSNHQKISRILNTLNSVGLGYIKLGQSATTLSGGEAQRLKLSRELAKRAKGKCLYVLDEPTTGLHFEDVRILLEAINQLVEQGHTVLIIEHNLDVLKSADHLIDLGPEGGDKGGTIVATGTPEEVSESKNSHTARFLREIL